MGAPEGSQHALKDPDAGPQDSFIQMRITREKKQQIVRAAVKRKQKLTDYIMEAIEEKMGRE